MKLSDHPDRNDQVLCVNGGRFRPHTEDRSTAAQSGGENAAMADIRSGTRKIEKAM